MKKLQHAAFYGLLLMAVGSANITLQADEREKVIENSPRQGVLRGRIIDKENQTLPGASIFIEKLQMGVTSDVNGFFTLSNLEPGTYTVKVSYVGYSPV